MAEQQQPKFRIQDNPSVIETYANKFLGSAFDGSAVTLTFGSIRVPGKKTDNGPMQGEQPLMIQVTHRLTLPPAAVMELINGLDTTMKTLRHALARAQGATHQTGHA